ncbi:TIGR04211 family SH3 domain-containing protein [Marinomonas sp. TW1]|uniref:TIGR04211 family SH3 domain-containing protein n=1 Tax=Marinomonas sp. TW1 TaxID=1561203 RepID=UPI001E3353F2|nr:TIGR04211 family SH3 domain-containing protein [Marinomonas sp. TW1]
MHLISLLVGSVLSASASAVTVYVSDIQFVAIREGQDNSTRAVERGIKSGTPLEVLEQSNGYSKVRTPTGAEGWVADYYLSDDMVTRDQLEELQRRLTTAIQRRNNINNELKESQAEAQALLNTQTELQQENQALKAQLEDVQSIAEKAEIIVSQNDTVTYQIESLKQQASIAEQASQQLQNSHQQKWFMIGAATLFGGLLLGTLLPLLRRKKAGTGNW